jgi:hypothetical protein
LRQRFLLAVLFASFASSLIAASTKLVLSWRNPAASAKHFQKILVIGMSDKVEVRANFEDALSAKLARPGIEVIPGHTILLRPEGTAVNLVYIKTQIRENNIDGVVVSRLVKIDKNITYVPGEVFYPYPYYRTFYGYYGTVYPVVYSPGYLKEEKKIRIETNFYSTGGPEGELVWTGMSDTFNPSSTKKAIDGVVNLVVKELEKQQLLGAVSANGDVDYQYPSSGR